MPARSRAAEPSGSCGSSTSSPALGDAFDWSTPAFAHTKPWWVTQMSVPSTARSSSADSSSTACTSRAILAVLARERAGALAGLDLVEAAHAALGLRDHLVGHHQHVAVAEVGRSRRRHQAREVVTRPHGRERRERGDAQRGQAGVRAGAVHAPARSSWRSAPRVDGAWPRRPSSAAASSARSPGVSTSSVKAGHLLHPVRHARRLGRRHVARAAARSEARLDHVGRREHERVGAGAVTVGHDHDARRKR